MAKTRLNLPDGANTVRVRMVDTSCALSIRAESFINPTVRGQDNLEVTDQCFLIEHAPSGLMLMFDLGVRKDYWNLPPVVLSRLSQGLAVRSLKVPSDVPELLAASGISLDHISAVVWSHYHWDHIGNMAVFPSTTKLVVGPGFRANEKVMPGWPENAMSPVPSDSFAGRELLEVDFAGTDLMIGGFRAWDYFGDGSFYLLDTPGHCVGHICGLARTTTEPQGSFVFLGGDICHFAGCFRPSESFPLAANAVEKYLCPGDCSHSSSSPDEISHSDAAELTVDKPVHRVSTAPSSAYIQASTAQQSVEKLIAFDSSPDVLVLLAHDPSLPKHLPTLNDGTNTDLNSWRGQDWKSLCRWDWLQAGPVDAPSESAGFWRDGRVWSTAKQELAAKSQHVVGTGL